MVVTVFLENQAIVRLHFVARQGALVRAGARVYEFEHADALGGGLVPAFSKIIYLERRATGWVLPKACAAEIVAGVSAGLDFKCENMTLVWPELRLEMEGQPPVTMRAEAPLRPLVRVRRLKEATLKGVDDAA